MDHLGVARLIIPMNRSHRTVHGYAFFAISYQLAMAFGVSMFAPWLRVTDIERLFQREDKRLLPRDYVALASGPIHCSGTCRSGRRPCSAHFSS